MYTVASFFAGVGGIDLGFEETGQFQTIWANEFDNFAVKTFSANFPNVHIDTSDIRNVSASNIPNCDIIIGGFPCQAFSIAGYQEGFTDKKGRGELFFELTRIIKEKQPRVAFFENVKNLIRHDNGRTFKVICNKLMQLGYKYKYQILNAADYGNLAQNRERIYIVAFKNESDYNNFIWPKPIDRTTTVKDVIDFYSQFDEKYYYTKGKYNCDIYEKLVEATKFDDLENPNIYQWRRYYVRQNKSCLIPTLTANQGEGGHNVCIVKTKHGLRKMTPHECFKAQGFPKDFILPTNLPDSKLYKQAGNSVCVPVIKRIAQNIASALDSSTAQNYLFFSCDFNKRKDTLASI